MTALESALVAIDQFLAGNTESGTSRATARGLMLGYDLRWTNSPWKTIHREREFYLPIVNPDTGRASRTFLHGGKTDGILDYSGKRFLCEHKSCNEDIQDPDAPYWRRLEIDAQVNGYMLSQWQEGTKLEGTLYDVIRRPAIRPKIITKDAWKEIHFQGTYCQLALSQELKNTPPASGSTETPELFELRLAADATARPDFYFQRKTIYRMDNQLLEFARELWETADEIRLAQNHNRHYRNTGACMNWGRPCTFLPLCSGHSTLESDRWEDKERTHPELSEQQSTFDLPILTHSRMQLFKTCKRKHYYSYELGIQKRQGEDSEAIYFGSLMHHALAAWWSHPDNSLQGEGNDASSLPVNVAGSGA